MKLKDLIRGKKENERVATATLATPATPATNEHEDEATVANVATVSVANPWEGEIDEAANDTRQQRVEGMLVGNPALKYAVLVDDATADPVVVTVGIREMATFDLHIPLSRYDGIALLQVIDQYALETDLNGIGKANPLPYAKECSQEPPSNQRKTA